MDALSPMDLPWLPAEWAQDQRLSYGARGILAELVDTPPDGEMSLERLVIAGGPGGEPADVIECYLVELEKVGYLERTEECWFLSDPHPL